MKNKMAKIFPIILFLCFIVDTISLYTGISANAWTVVSVVSTAISSLSLAFVILYIVIVKEDPVLSKWAKIGMIGLLIYVLITFGNVALVKIFDRNYIKAYLFISKIASVLRSLIEALQYICIVELIIPKPKNSFVRMAKMAAMVFIAGNCLAEIGLVFSSYKLGTTFYKIRTTLSSLFKYCAYIALLLNVVAEEETLHTAVPKSKEKNSATPNTTNVEQNINNQVSSQNVAQNTVKNQVPMPAQQQVRQPVQQSPQQVNTTPQNQNQNKQ